MARKCFGLYGTAFRECQGTAVSAQLRHVQRHGPSVAIELGRAIECRRSAGSPLRAGRISKPGTPSATSAIRAAIRTRGASSRRCTGDASGRCGSTRGSGRPPNPTGDTGICSRRASTGLSVAFDLPTQIGYDSDHPLAAGEVGRVGVAIDSIEDMAELFDGIPLDRVSTSMTINATRRSSCSRSTWRSRRRQGSGHAPAVGHDSERHPEGVHRARHLHLSAARLAAHHHRHLRVLRARAAELEHDFDQRLSHSRSRFDGGPGSRLHVRQRHRLRPGRDRRRARRERLRRSDSRSSSTATTIFWRRSPSSARRAGCGRAHARSFRSPNPRALQLRFHAQTAGSTLTAQQPDNNIVRVALQALAAVLGGTQSLHTNATDEALALPTEEAARLALRTQQIVALRKRRRQHGGSRSPARGRSKSSPTKSRPVRAEFSRGSTALGGTLAAIEQGIIQREMQESAYRAPTEPSTTARSSSSASIDTSNT